MRPPGKDGEPKADWDASAKGKVTLGDITVFDGARNEAKVWDQRDEYAITNMP